MDQNVIVQKIHRSANKLDLLAFHLVNIALGTSPDLILWLTFVICLLGSDVRAMHLVQEEHQ